ncbi:hypothetical protein CGLO_06478 [Colletotrichum gloeosporioides Cg-14]|uniref:Uncharacterized protein n=1 Tax=Colletotrichum gloeosporioides (strain Cg-14) TaxID=1237896 RepID=T0LPY5_COLGC|nr:hypothetical protein CGLO_06478 [Colletotrichum gloeosporioides Cg-14]
MSASFLSTLDALLPGGVRRLVRGFDGSPHLHPQIGEPDDDARARYATGDSSATPLFLTRDGRRAAILGTTTGAPGPWNIDPSPPQDGDAVVLPIIYLEGPIGQR